VPARRFLRTSAFRLTLAYGGLFGLSILVLLGFIYWNTSQSISRTIDETIGAEIDALTQHYRLEGVSGLIAAIDQRTDRGPLNGGLYLLTGADGRRLAGNLDLAAATAARRDDRLTLPLTAADGTPAEGRARRVDLAGGLTLLVGRDTRALAHFQLLMAEAMAWAFFGALLLGTGGGLLLSRRVLARIDGITRGAERIMRGDLSHRMRLDGSSDEFDRLAATLNAMLDEIERLMTGIRTVTNNIAHDLRSPLTRMRTQLERTIASGDADDLREAGLHAMAEADSLLATFNALLSIAEAEAGIPVADAKPVDVAHLIEDVVDLYGPLAEDKGLEITAACPPGVTVHGSRELLFQALSNLIDNAIKYTPAPGAITVRADATGATVDLSVSDTGPGIPAADRTRVLDRFVRLDTSRSTPGNGLGLSLVKAIARMHRAGLRLEDAAPGLRVVIALPKTA